MTDPAPSPATADPLGLVARSHPLRGSLSYEMHLRKLPRFATPCRLLQVVTLLGEGGAHASHTHVDALCAQCGERLAPDARYAVLEAAGFQLVWERHTEFATYTFLDPGAFASPFAAESFAGVRGIIDAMPGEVVRATRIALLGRDAPTPADAAIAASFGADGLVMCDVAGGKARIWSDFQLNADGLGRLLVADRGLERDDPAQLVQRMQELGNYRNMALLGLPLAQALAPDVAALEKRLATLTHDVSEPSAADERLLDELTFLSAELARLVAETRYRLSATRAYAQITADRLASLEVVALPGYQTLADFTERRLTPAVRTCESFEQRLEDMSRRTAWTSSLLRTRIDTALARQNRDLLASMDRRTHVQLRLQQAVEGLSIVAISYYLVALIGYVLHAVPIVQANIALAMAATVPLVLAFVALLLRWLRRGLEQTPPQ